ncbi:MAG TPA: hypothetical protein DEG43_13915 [Acidimicrobiaceae bacterium]|nr:hypothetical protein [Acidimicrobiaceae bacterium]
MTTCPHPRHGRIRTLALTTALGVFAASSLVGCASSQEAADNTLDPKNPPQWLIDAARMAREEKARMTATTEPEDGSTSSKSSPAAATGGVLGRLTALGLTPDQASCVLGAIESDPALADLSAGLFGPNAVQPTEGQTAALLAAVSPCVDPAVLLSLFSGSGGGSLPLGDYTAALQQAKDIVASGQQALEVAQLAAGKLGPEAVANLQALLTAASAAGAAQATQALTGINLASLDLAKLNPEQLAVLIAAVLRGMSDPQRQELLKLGNLNLALFPGGADLSSMTPEQVGTLLLLISPILASTVSSSPTGPPPGVDPGQIYLPPGTDLSNINPLLFAKKSDIVAELMKSGLPEATAGCLFERLRLLSTTTLAAIFSSTPSEAAQAEVGLIVISCIFSPV